MDLHGIVFKKYTLNVTAKFIWDFVISISGIKTPASSADNVKYIIRMIYPSRSLEQLQ